MKQTNAQKLAIDPSISARVSANAGTGKTYILVSRFLRLLLAGSHPNRILCLTYTKAAAAEMSERITLRLKDWVLKNSADLEQDLEELLERKPTAQEMERARKLFTVKLQSMPPPRIQTIHSFCQEVLSSFALEASLNQGFSVADELTTAEFLLTAKRYLLSGAQIEKKVKNAINYLAINASEFKLDSVLSDVISNRNKYRNIIDKFPDEDDYIENLYENFQVNRGQDFENLENKIRDFEPDFFKEYMQALEPSSGKRDQENLFTLIGLYDDFDNEKYTKIFLRADNQPKTLSYLIGKKALENAPDLEEKLHEEQQRLANIIEQINSLKVAEFSENIAVIAYSFMKIYEDIKRKNNMLDYEDLTYYLLKLLENSNSAAWILYKLDGGIEHMLIDEAQDTSPEQWQIIKYLADDFFAGQGAAEKDRTIFIVGDEKQSIYSFQGADPKSFSSVASEFAINATQSGKNWLEISLNKSFRSNSAILGFVDKIFNNEQIKNAVSFTDKAIEHEVHRIGEGGIIEIWPLQEKKEKEKFGAWEPPIQVFESNDAEADLAKKIAKEISSWLEKERILKSTGKRIRPDDVMILLRKRGAFANKLIKELKNKNIPVAGSDRLNILEHIAIMDLIALGNFVLLNEDDYSLACALKSPLFNMSENELFDLCYDRGGVLFDNIKLNNNALFEELNALNDTAKTLSPYQFYTHILDIRSGRKKFISRLGDEVNDPLNEFLELCLNFEETKNSSLQEFLYWLSSEDILIKRDMQESTGKVRVMTIHASKGLQSPIVILPDTTSTPSSDAKNSNSVIWLDNLFVSSASSKFYNQQIKTALEKQKLKESDEYLRLLYVALTRAEDEIYIAGVEKGKSLAKDSWYSILQENMQIIAEKHDEKLRFETEQTKIIEKGADEQAAIFLETIPDFYFKTAKPLTN